MGYDVFISFKRGALDGSGTTRDFELARDLHQTLLKSGVNAFFSEKDLSTADFMREIYTALDEAKVLVVVGTNRAHMDSKWVRSEWSFFLSAIWGGRKPNGELYSYLEGMSNLDLPPELYSRQFYTSAQKDELVKRILQNLGQSAPAPNPPSLLDVRVGDILEFGQYPQGENGEIAPLEWRVLDVYDGKALLITDKLVDCKPYHEKRIDITWEDCTLRKWLNRDFMSRAFSSREQAKIALTTNPNPANPRYGTAGGKNTQDKIFALSIEEAARYFRNRKDRMATATAYAKKQGCYVSDSYTPLLNTSCWWLRSPGGNSNDAALVNLDGSIDQGGGDVGSYDVAVRPAFRLNL